MCGYRRGGIEMSSELRNAASPYFLPWEKGQAFLLSPTYLEGHYAQRTKIVEKRNWPVFEVISAGHLKFDLEWGGKHFFVEVLVNPTALCITCSCKAKVHKLCFHAAQILYDYVTYKPKFFERFYFKELEGLPAEQLALFKFKRAFLDAAYTEHPQYGRVFNYGNKDEKMNLFPVFNPLPTSELVADGKLMFVLSQNLFVADVPLLLPFLSKDHYGKQYSKCYLVDDQMPRPIDQHTPLTWALESISKEMIALGLKEKELDPYTVASKMVALWRQVCKLPLEKNSFTLSYTTNKLQKVKYTGSYEVDEYVYRISNGDLSIHFSVNLFSSYTVIELSIMYKGERIKNPRFIHNSNSYFIAVQRNEFLFIDDVKTQAYIHYFRNTGYRLTVLKQNEEYFFANFFLPVFNHFDGVVNDMDSAKRLVELPTPPVVLHLRIYYEEDYLVLSPTINYGSRLTLDLSRHASLYFEYEHSKLHYFYRNRSLEDSFLNLLDNHTKDISGLNEMPGGKRYIPIAAIQHTNWLNTLLKDCKASEITYTLEELEQGSTIYPYELSLKLSAVREVNDVYHIAVSVVFGSCKLSVEELKDWLFRRKSVFTLPDKKIAWLDQVDRDVYRPIFAKARIEGNELIIPEQHILVLDRLLDQIDSDKLKNVITERKALLSKISSIPLVEVPKSIQADLRPYQVAGFSWMVFLKKFKWGGILADEMGLGKTLQVIALLEHHFLTAPTSNSALIVVPTSLLFNWEQELIKFVPQRAFTIHHGINRPKVLSFKSNSLVITTYGTLLADVDLFKNYRFSYLVLDESQSIKNRLSKRFKAVSELHADQVMALSGTPIENSIEDLYTQINLVNPAIFGSFTEFKRTYPGLIDGTAAEETVNEFQQVIHPFILRRTKDQVASELPEKTEIVLTMDMLPVQQEIYDRYRIRYKDRLEKEYASGIVDRIKFSALEGLMKLRQICNSPCLIKEEDFPTSSVKIEKLIETLSNISEHHKVLVFSFFTSMLQRVKEAIVAEHISYSYLDGKLSAKERETAVAQFQNDPEVKVFLISLKAGGTGLNLTAADYVFILDPWWNPAAEAQAVGRSHRMGQSNPVMVYKTICRNSVEEKILELQQRKMRLAKGLIQEEQQMLKTLSKEDILALFS